MSAPTLEPVQHPSWCDRSQCFSDADGPAHGSAWQQWTTAEGQAVSLYLMQVPGEAPRVVLDAGSPWVEDALLLTIEEATDLMGRLAPLVAAAMPRGRCTR